MSRTQKGHPWRCLHASELRDKGNNQFIEQFGGKCYGQAKEEVKCLKPVDGLQFSVGWLGLASFEKLEEGRR